MNRIFPILRVAAAGAIIALIAGAPGTNYLNNAVLTGFSDVRGKLVVTGDAAVAGSLAVTGSGAFGGGVTALHFVGSGAMLSGIPSTNGLASTGYVAAAVAGSTQAISVTTTNQFWDVDTLVAPATTGGVTYFNPGSGPTYSYSAIEVWPVYSNEIGRVFGSPMTDSRSAGDEYHGWAWDGQSNAVGYLVHANVLISPDYFDYYTNLPAGALSIAVSQWPGSDTSPKPTSVSRTNEIVSSYLVSLAGEGGSNAIRSIAAPMTNGAATMSDLAGATNGIATMTNGLASTGYVASAVAAASAFPPTNRVAYADPQFPVWAPPYFGNIQSALVWLGSSGFPDGTHTNHGVLRISGQWSVSGARLDVTTDKYDWLTIIADGATIDCNVANVGNEKGWLDFGSSVERVTIRGGKWAAWQNFNNNGSILYLRGAMCAVTDADLWTYGSNWNLTAAVFLKGAFASAARCTARIAPGPKGSGNYLPINFPANGGTTSLVTDCAFDLWEVPGKYFHLGGDQGQSVHQFVRCIFRHYNWSYSAPLFIRVAPGDRWESCTFANVVNPALYVTGQVALAAPEEGGAGWVSGTGYVGGYYSDPDYYSFHHAMRVYPFRTNASGAVNCSTNSPLEIHTDSPTDELPYDIAWWWTNSPGTLHGYRLVRYNEEDGWNWNQFRDVPPAVTNLLDDGTGWSAGAVAYALTTNLIWGTNAPGPVIGGSGDSPAKTIFVNNCVFNQANWATNHNVVSNNVTVATNYQGIILPPAM